MEKKTLFAFLAAFFLAVTVIFLMAPLPTANAPPSLTVIPAIASTSSASAEHQLIYVAITEAVTPGTPGQRAILKTPLNALAAISLLTERLGLSRAHRGAKYLVIKYAVLKSSSVPILVVKPNRFKLLKV